MLKLMFVINAQYIDVSWEFMMLFQSYELSG